MSQRRMNCLAALWAIIDALGEINRRVFALVPNLNKPQMLGKIQFQAARTINNAELIRNLNLAYSARHAWSSGATMNRRNLDLGGQYRPNMLIRAPAYALDECSAAWAGRLDHSRRFLLVPWLFSSVVQPSHTGTCIFFYFIFQGTTRVYFFQCTAEMYFFYIIIFTWVWSVDLSKCMEVS